MLVPKALMAIGGGTYGASGAQSSVSAARATGAVGAMEAPFISPFDTHLYQRFVNHCS